MIPSKLKVVELRAELSARGLDTKGVKAALVERLEKALEQENSGAVNDAHAENAETDVNNEKDESTILDDTKDEESMETSRDEDMPENLSQSPTKRDQSPVKQESPIKHESPIKEPVISTPTPVIQEQKSPEKIQEHRSPEKPVEQTPESVQGHVSPVKPAEEHSSPEKPIQEPEKPTQEHSSPEKPIQEHLPSENLNQEESTDKTDEKPQDSVKEEEVKPDVEKMEESLNEEGGLNGSVKEGFEVKVEAEPMDVKEEKESKGRYESRSDRREDRKRRRSRSSSPRREHSRSIKEEEPELKENEITLSWYDSDLNLSIDTTKFLEARPFSDDGFGYIWAGVRGTHGFTSGKICYQVRLKDNCNVSHLEDEPNPNVLRVGWSDFSTSLQLGEEPFSYGFGGTGKISENCKFNDYGKQFSVGDVVTAFLEFTETDFVISFAVNEEIFGEAYRVPIETIESKLKPWALAPHILTKNVKFEVNFGQEESWADVKTEHLFISKVPIENAVAGPKRPEKRAECEMVMMCGLPGAGKTFWANKHKAENPEKNYNILGTNALIDKMKVMGLPRKANYHGRWDVLIEKCTKCLGRLMDIGSRRRRHYILDQTNVFPAAQRRKMRNFEGFIRKAVVVVPSEEEFQKRLELVQNEDKKDVPDSAVLEMKANFTLPDKSMFEEVIYTELEESEAKELLQKYSKEASEKGYEKRQHSGPPSKRFRPDYHHGPRQDYRRHGPPAGYRRGGMDRGPPPRGNWSRGGPDRWRDNRHSGGGFRQGDRGGGGWRGMGMSGGRRDFDRPRSYDGRSNRGPNSQPRQGNNFRDNRDRGKPKPRGGPSSGGNNASGANNAQGQWNSQNQYSGQQSQPWNSSGQNWGPWSGYQQQQFKGFSQGATGNFGAQQPAQPTQQTQQQPQQGYPQNYSQGYTNWQQYGYPGYGQNWPVNSQNKDGNPVGATWQNWYTQNQASANTSQPPSVKKEF